MIKERIVRSDVRPVQENMNCICDLLDNECFWIILIALALIYCNNNAGNSCGCGCRG